MSDDAKYTATRQATVEPLGDGWVSHVDTSLRPKVRLADTKPYRAPLDIKMLHGSDSGRMKLPSNLHRGSDRWLNLTSSSSLQTACQTILQEGGVEDICRYLNGDVLQSIWPDLTLPARLVDLWEQYVLGFNPSPRSAPNTYVDKVESMKSLFGCIPDDGMTVEQIREERLARYEDE